jgi:DNA polymerase III subunit epsilon
MRWTSQPIVAFDTETTGLQPFAGDRVIEFGAVVIHVGPDGRVAGVEPYSWLVDPQIPIPKKVVEITGIQDSDVAGRPPFSAIASEVVALLRDRVTVAHNFPFDMAFLSAELRRVGLDWPEPLAEIDTVDVSMRAFPGARSHRLGDLCKRLDISLVEAHRATNDAEACGRAFVELARQAELPDDLDALVAWAGGVGRPPPEGPFGLDEAGRLVFLEGKHRGEPVREHPLHLMWMQKALTRNPDGWAPTHPEPVREWIRRFLAVRGAGRHRPSPKSFRADDWALDSCIADRDGSAV